MKPTELLYSKTHEWTHIAEADGQRIATIGISDFAIQQLTDLVYLELPEVGRVVAVGDSIGEIESVKAVSDLYAPVAGEIVAANEPLKDSLEAFSDDPYGAGWIVKIRLSADATLDQLVDYDTYSKQCAEEG